MISHKSCGEEEDVNEGSLPIHDIYEVHSALPVEEKSKYGDRGYDNVALCLVKESLGQGEYPGSGSEYMDSSIDNKHNETNVARQLILRLEALEANRQLLYNRAPLFKVVLGITLHITHRGWSLTRKRFPVHSRSVE